MKIVLLCMAAIVAVGQCEIKEMLVDESFCDDLLFRPMMCSQLQDNNPGCWAEKKQFGDDCEDYCVVTYDDKYGDLKIRTIKIHDAAGAHDDRKGCRAKCDDLKTRRQRCLRAADTSRFDRVCDLDVAMYTPSSYGSEDYGNDRLILPGGKDGCSDICTTLLKDDPNCQVETINKTDCALTYSATDGFITIATAEYLFSSSSSDSCAAKCKEYTNLNPHCVSATTTYYSTDICYLQLAKYKSNTSPEGTGVKVLNLPGADIRGCDNRKICELLQKDQEGCEVTKTNGGCEITYNGSLGTFSLPRAIIVETEEVTCQGMCWKYHERDEDKHCFKFKDLNDGTNCQMHLVEYAFIQKSG